MSSIRQLFRQLCRVWESLPGLVFFSAISQRFNPPRIKMFERLQNKWKVKGFQLFLIICTFAIGGSLTGFVGKKIMNWLAVPEDWLWAVIYILLITLIWPLAVLVISIPLGQFRFFNAYIHKIGIKMGIVKNKEIKKNKPQDGYVK